MTALSITAKPEPFEIETARTAIVVVDMQNAYLSPGGYLDKVGFDVSASSPVIRAAAQVLSAARAAGLFVAHLQNGFDAEQTQAGGPTACGLASSLCPGAGAQAGFEPLSDGDVDWHSSV